MTASVLLVVDVQHGFINEWTSHVPAAAERLMRDYDQVVLTQFLNRPGSPYRVFLNWHEIDPGSREATLAVHVPRNSTVVIKYEYSLPSALIKDVSLIPNHAEVHICGVDTEGCVLQAAVQLFESGRRPIVLADACGSTGGPQAHHAGLVVLQRLIGARNVLSASGGNQ